MRVTRLVHFHHRVPKAEAGVGGAGQGDATCPAGPEGEGGGPTGRCRISRSWKHREGGSPPEPPGGTLSVPTSLERREARARLRAPKL